MLEPKQLIASLEAEIPIVETDMEGQLRGGFTSFAIIKYGGRSTNGVCNNVCNQTCGNCYTNKTCNNTCNQDCSTGTPTSTSTTKTSISAGNSFEVFSLLF